MATIDDELIIYGGDLNIPQCKRNFSQYVLDKMTQNSDKIAQIDPVNKKTQTYAVLRLNSIRCALKLKQNGVRRGDIIMICGRNHLNLAVPLLASMYIGAPVNPLHPDYSRREILRMLKLTEPKVIFCDHECTKLMKELVTEIKLKSKIVTFETDFKSYLEPLNSAEEDNFVTETVDVFNDILYIVCTSGTTGLIKGVTITHNAFYIASNTCILVMENDSPILYYSPLSWISAMLLINAAALNGVSRMICEYNPTRNLEIILEYKIKWLFMTPMKAFEMINHPLFKQNISTISKNLRYFFFGGSPSSERQVQEIHQIFKNAFITNGYGCAEMSGGHSWLIRNKHEDICSRKIMSSGQPINGTYWKIVDPETGKNVGRNNEGELWIKGPALTKGYYKDPEATAQAIDKDGWFHTGDLVIVDDEDSLFVVGRINDQLKYKTWHVSSSELEDILKEHSAVEAVCVMGRPHETDGDLPLAFIVKRDSAKDVTEKEIIEFVNNQVCEYQKLRGGVIFLDDMPVTPSGKIRKLVLKQFINFSFLSKSMVMASETSRTWCSYDRQQNGN
ncbi:4-coumarate--CoA ligase-like [Chrysoperla carnea]|uniref:4-coumarate--CoA ligase-like n=1 Tax=Chrysoperla carnea TaxID=189513 RepID=UPI001D088E1E|nr:4-coumarate--CoA ligase-like [Chrysoperla carnea]